MPVREYSRMGYFRLRYPGLDSNKNVPYFIRTNIIGNQKRKKKQKKLKIGQKIQFGNNAKTGKAGGLQNVFSRSGANRRFLLDSIFFPKSRRNDCGMMASTRFDPE
jgi:hypothetical protein